MGRLSVYLFLAIIPLLLAVANRGLQALQPPPRWMGWVLIPLRLTLVFCLAIAIMIFGFWLGLFPNLPPQAILVAILLVGFAWAWLGLSWPATWSRKQRLVVAVSASVLTTLVVCLVMQQVAYAVTNAFLPEPEYQLASPTNPHDVVVYKNGWNDCILTFYAQSASRARIHFADEWCEGPGPNEAVFAWAQWTKDGQVFVCFDQLYKKVSTVGGDKYKSLGPTPEPVDAYDFSQQHAMNQDPDALQKLIAAHGGLAEAKVDFATAAKVPPPARFWQAQQK